MFKLSPLQAKAADLALASAVGEHGVIGWFSVEDLSHLGNGDAVAEWPSRMGGIKLEQTDAGKRPEMALTGFNGGPCVTFDNTSQGMLALHTGGVPSEKVSAIAVFYSDTSSGESCVTEYTGNVYNNRGFRLILKDGERRVALGADSGRSFVQGGDDVSEIKTIIAMRGDRSTNPDTLNMWDQQGLVTPTSSFFTNGSGDHESAYLYVGNRGNTGSLQLNGGIKELIVLAGYVDDNDMRLLLDLVAKKHSIPYFDVAPVASGGGGGGGVTYNFDDVHNTTVTDSEGTLYDDGGPDGNYSSNEYWVTIDAPAGQQVELTFVSFEMGNPGNWYERLRVWDNNASSGTILAEFSGSMSAGNATAPTSGQTLTSTNGHVFIRQDSSTSDLRAGFEITWRFV
jgi:hypothetical protein